MSLQALAEGRSLSIPTALLAKATCATYRALQRTTQKESSAAARFLLQVGTGRAYAFAKGCGQLLNLNAMFLLLPVIRSLIQRLHDLTSGESYNNILLFWVPYVMQLDKNVVFHKAIAKYFILTASVGHGVAHYFNYARAPYYYNELGPAVSSESPTIMAWAPVTPGSAWAFPSPGLTGQLLALVMMLIYSGAHDTVKRRHYETFWYTHHLFILFFALLITHGPVWYQWSLVPLLAYTVDRVVVRILLRGNKRMALMRVYFWSRPDKVMPDVVTLQFDNAVSDRGVKPLKYQEGSYLYLQCPAAENSRFACLGEWHPFTISSAPDEPVLEVNLRVMESPHSWTNKVARYMMLLDPQREGVVELSTRNPTTGDLNPGKVDGPDGRPFFRVDAPHGAPSQHVFRFKTCVLVGAGIGVTPCASILKGVINYRWKKGFMPRHFHFYWVARKSDLHMFKWLVTILPEIKAAQLRHNKDQIDGDPTVEINQLNQRVKALEREFSQLNGEGASAVAQADPNYPQPPQSRRHLPGRCLTVGWSRWRRMVGHTIGMSSRTIRRGSAPFGRRRQPPRRRPRR